MTKMYPIPTNVLPVTKPYSSKRSEMPNPEWYLEQFRSHVGEIHELFRVCPPQQWKSLSLSIGDALAKAGEKVGVKTGLYVQTKDASRKEKRFGKGLKQSVGCIAHSSERRTPWINEEPIALGKLSERKALR